MQKQTFLKWKQPYTMYWVLSFMCEPSKDIKILAVHTKSLKLGLCCSGKIFFRGQKITF